METLMKLQPKRPTSILFLVFILLASLSPLNGAIRFGMSGEGLDSEPLLTTAIEGYEVKVDLLIEPWMTTPFENSVAEVDLGVEKWMTTSFENSMLEAELNIEKWMSIPFEVAEHIEIESWMTDAF